MLVGVCLAHVIQIGVLSSLGLLHKRIQQTHWRLTFVTIVLHCAVLQWGIGGKNAMH